mmetsp:Transcript_19221/g.53546  ORF Transcript_19221/g.53546 Transcript_19221/m.53546 type:complete len:241 (+) Transcript_19221:99-821(+)
MLVLVLLRQLRVAGRVLLLLDRLGHDLDDVFVVQLVRKTASLGGVHGTPAPYQSVIEVPEHLRRNVGAERFHRGSLSNVRQHDGFFEIRRRTLSLGINSSQTQVFPHFLLQRIVFQGFANVPLFVDASDDGMGLPRQLIHFLDRNGVDLVVQIQGRLVFAISEGYVHQLVHRDFFSCQHIGADNLVFPQNLRHDLFGLRSELGLGHRARKLDAASHFSLAYRDIGRALVETNPDGFQFLF